MKTKYSKIFAIETKFKLKNQSHLLTSSVDTHCGFPKINFQIQTKIFVLKTIPQKKIPFSPKSKNQQTKKLFPIETRKMFKFQMKSYFCNCQIYNKKNYKTLGKHRQKDERLTKSDDCQNKSDQQQNRVRLRMKYFNFRLTKTLLPFQVSFFVLFILKIFPFKKSYFLLN